MYSLVWEARLRGCAIREHTTQRYPCGSRAQVTVGIMMAPIMHLAHCASIPLVLLARAETDKVRPSVSTSRHVPHAVVETHQRYTPQKLIKCMHTHAMDGKPSSSAVLTAKYTMQWFR